LEQWAANTLRRIGIAVIAIIVIPANLLLLLLSLVPWGGGIGGNTDHSQAIAYLVGTVLLDAVASIVSARLSRGILRPIPGSTASGSSPVADSGVPTHLSPASLEALRNLIYAIGASIVLGAIFWGNSLYRIWTNYGLPQSLSYRRNWMMTMLISAILNYLPDIILFFRLQRKPDRPALAFAIAIPAAGLLRTFTMAPLTWRYLWHGGNFMQSQFPFAVGLGMQVIVLFLAWRANQRLGYRQELASLAVAGVASYLYFIIFGSASTWLYRFIG